MLTSPTHCASLLLAVLCAAGCSATPTESETHPPRTEEFDTAADRDPSAATLYRMACLLKSQHRDAEAARLLVQTVERYPEFLAAYGDLAELQLKYERTGDAIQTLAKGLERYPQDASLLNNLGMCWFQANEHERALRCFTRAAAIAPQDRRYRANLASALAMLGRYEESLGTYLQVLGPNSAHHNLAVLCEARGDLERAQVERQLAGVQPAATQGADASGG